MLLKIVTSSSTAIISAVPPKKDSKKDALDVTELLLLSFIFRIVIYYSIYSKKKLILDFPCFHTCLLFKFILKLCKAIFFLL